MSKSEFYRTADVADLLGVTRQTLANWRVRKVGPAFLKVGPRLYIYPKSAVETFLASAERETRYVLARDGQPQPETA